MRFRGERGVRFRRGRRDDALCRSEIGPLRGCAVALVALAMGVTALTPSPASAAFTRPFLRQLTGTPTGPGGSEVPFNGPTGVAVDAEGDLWVAEQETGKLDKFDSAGNFVSALELTFPTSEAKGSSTPPLSLSIDRSTGDFFITGTTSGEFGFPKVEMFNSSGFLVKSWGSFGSPAHVAVDNSVEPIGPCGGVVYVTHARGNPAPQEGGDGLPDGLEKFNTCGERANFGGSAAYIKGPEITGTPNPNGGVDLFQEPAAGSVAVDGEGNIFVADVHYRVNAGAEGAIVMYNARGEFQRAFTDEGIPSPGEQKLRGVAVDPVSGDVLGSVTTPKEGLVDEFDSSGHFLNQIAETTAGTNLSSAVEMTFDSHGDLYVVDSKNASGVTKHAVDVFGPGFFLPTLSLGEASEREPSSAVLNGAVNPESAVNPEKAGLSDCHFEYVTDAAFQHNVEVHEGRESEGFADLSSGGVAPCVPGAGEIPKDGNTHDVHGNVSHLLSGTTYRYRLLATTEGARGGVSESSSLAFTAPHAPAMDSTSATNLSSTFADLHARINPLGADTSYHFEYSSDGMHWVNAPVPDADIGSGGPTGSADASVVRQIGPLAPGTSYAFRVFARNSAGETLGEERTFTTLAQVAQGLPDRRAYELVTPPNKGSAEDMFAASDTEHNDFFNFDVGYPSESGERFLLQTVAAFGPSPASGTNAYIFSRTHAGWETTALTSPSPGVQSVVAAVFDPSDLSRVGIDDHVGSLSSVAGTQNEELVGTPGDAASYATLHTSLPVHFGEEEREIIRIVGASGDLKVVALESNGQAPCGGTEGQDAGSDALCEWAGGYETADEELRPQLKLVDVNRCGSVLGQGHLAGTRHNAISADGSRIFFTAPDPYAANDGPGCWNGASSNTPQLYMRLGGAVTELSVPDEAGLSNPCHPASSGCHPAIYVGASEDGSKVFFVTETALTKDAVELKLRDPELYEYDLEAPEGQRLTRVSRGNLSSGPTQAEVYTVPVVSADGAATYFTAFGELTSDAPAVSGEEVNLYRYDTGSGAIAYVATVSMANYPSTEVAAWWPGHGFKGELAREVALDVNANWYTTPDGRYLLFDTASQIASYSTAEASPFDCPALDRNSSLRLGHCNEVYRYDAELPLSNGKPGVADNPACVSCNPSGAPPTSNAFFGHSASFDTPAAGPVRAMSNDGSYAFFDTADALVPQDGNGTLDVYEWHDGRVSLISSGQDPAPSYFLGSSAANIGGVEVQAANVFFGTHARLVPRDTDTAGDVYDARVGGGFGVEVGQGPCEGDACQNPPPAPIDATPASLTFSGAGNLLVQAPPPPVKKTAAQIKAEKLASALKACRKKPKKKRAACEKQARRAYGPARKARKSRKGGKS